MKILIKIFLSVSLITLFINSGYSQEHVKAEFDCSSCHECETPTKSNPCLVICPRKEMMTVHIPADMSPKIIKMSKLEVTNDLYEPVIFSHRLHAEMSEMSGGCQMCHHYNPPGKVVSCIECHEADRNRTDISKPDLKGAYHRQCMDCHKEWSNKVTCESCHELNSSGKTAFKEKDLEKENIHPKLSVPTRLIYKTPKQKETVVTFFHNEHNDLFGLDCNNCHREESCVKCHDKNKLMETKELSLKEKHTKCSACHNTEMKGECESCHSKNELEPFNHLKRTGFNLKSYHAKLECVQCHKTKSDFSGLTSTCSGCHKEWDSKTFDHKVTGLILDETHLEFECGDCHLEQDFSKAPSCENCHDDKSFPNDKPGKIII
jgi:hypothetical protein